MAGKKNELAFLPAALEIQEQPPSPIGRTITWAIVFLFTAAIVWACFGKLDIVAVAQGKVIPEGRSKVIQPLETSVVRAIHVRNGQAVSQGELLIELDSTDARANLEQLRDELHVTHNAIIRARALLEALDLGQLDLSSVSNEFDPADWPLQKQLLASYYKEITSGLEENRHAIERARWARSAAQEQVRKLNSILPIITERENALERLADKNLVARTQYLELKQELIETEQGLLSEQAAKQAAAAQVEELVDHGAVLIADHTNTILIELEELQRRRDSLESEITKASQATMRQLLTTPIDGVVQQLSVFTIGGVVTPAEQLMVIVPSTQDLEVEAMVLNKDIGFVREGLPAVVKVDAFPYTRYGYIEAEVVTISDDAVPVEDLGLTYAAIAKLAKTSLEVDGRRIPLAPGMAVTVEVKTGTRRVIEYLLSPLLRYSSESARER